MQLQCSQPLLSQITIFILKCGKNSQVHSFEWFIFRSSLLLYGQNIKHTSPYIDDGSSWHEKQPHHNQINKDEKCQANGISQY